MSNPIVIRPYQPTDLDPCVQILLDNPLWQRYALTRSGAEKMLAGAAARQASILIAETGGIAAGFVWYVSSGAWDRSGYIRLIGVSPAYQGRGVGERLMSAAEQRVAELAPDIFLLVTDSNTGAQRFYRRIGYAQVGAIPDYVVPGIAELIFYKRLTPVPVSATSLE